LDFTPPAKGGFSFITFKVVKKKHSVKVIEFMLEQSCQQLISLN
tara:strand:- start:35 stop:166 length:132 start_codon:yes stop_codon:yes gene_type:complete